MTRHELLLRKFLLFVLGIETWFKADCYCPSFDLSASINQRLKNSSAAVVINGFEEPCDFVQFCQASNEEASGSAEVWKGC